MPPYRSRHHRKTTFFSPWASITPFPISSSRRRHQFNSHILPPTLSPRLVSQRQACGLERVVEADAEDDDANEDYRDGGVALHGG